MTQPLTAPLAEAISAHLAAPDHSEALRAAMQAYREDPSTAKKAIAIIDEIAKTTKPLEELLQKAWRDALQSASAAGLIQIQVDGPSNTVFDDIWTPLSLNGWVSLPDYRQKDLTEALAQTTRNTHFDTGTTPKGTPEQIAEALLSEISSGNLPLGPGAGDCFINWADGAQLDIEMAGWAPKLTHKGGRPTKMPDETVFKTKLELLSGRVLVADSVDVDPCPEMLSQLRSALGLSINYAWHRITRTAQTANFFNVVDIAMGDDGPGLVRAPGQDTIFASRANDDYPEIANVCHDYWGTTMIDRAMLVRAMLKTETAQDEADAEAQIDAWLAKSDYHTEIEMAPGTWHLYWDDDRQTLDAALRLAGIDAPEDTRFVLSREEIDLPGTKLKELSPKDPTAD